MNSDRFQYYKHHALIVVPKITSLSGYDLEWVQERAGIREFQGKQSRQVAEMEACIDFAYFRAGKERP
jgi:hypothetical protein